MSKVCSKCKEDKPLTEFHKNKSSKDGLAYWCRGCISTNNQKYLENRREAVRRWEQRNPGARKTYKAAWYQKNKERIIAKQKAQREAAKNG